MAAHHLEDYAAAGGRPKAVLFRGEAASAEDEKLARLLDCLGLPWEWISPKELTGTTDRKANAGSGRFCVMTSASGMRDLLGAEGDTGQLSEWLKLAESVYVYGFSEDSASQELLRRLTGDPGARVRRASAKKAAVSVSSEFPELCAAMSGVHFEARIPEGQTFFDLAETSERQRNILSTTQGQLFVRVDYGGARFFLNAGVQVVDVSAASTKYFDVREKFCDTVPAVMYAKWALGNGERPEISGALIVDDPPLKPRYGFLKYRDALELMDKHNFATTIAFIPWNWHRTDSGTVRLFHERPDKLSLCVHGCDHTAREFAERSAGVLNKRANVANYRMQLFGRRTELPYDRVMLFPQGAFSAGAARALKLNGFMAAANTEVAPVQKDDNKTTVGDLLGMAIMKYASFPMFTRRYLAHGVENFAFDGLLGKPCLIAAHHDDFAGEGRVLLQVVAKLNALNWKLRWRSLGESISRSFRMRSQREGECVEMYGTSLVYRNANGAGTNITFVKEENDFDCVKDVTVNGRPVDYLQQGGVLKFQATVAPNDIAELRITYSTGSKLPLSEDGVKYRAKAVLRRYLSEFRDNYLSQNELLQHSAVRIKEALRL